MIASHSSQSFTLPLFVEAPNLAPTNFQDQAFGLVVGANQILVGKSSSKYSSATIVQPEDHLLVYRISDFCS